MEREKKRQQEEEEKQKKFQQLEIHLSEFSNSFSITFNSSKADLEFNRGEEEKG